MSQQTHHRFVRLQEQMVIDRDDNRSWRLWEKNGRMIVPIEIGNGWDLLNQAFCESHPITEKNWMLDDTKYFKVYSNSYNG